MSALNAPAAARTDAEYEALVEDLEQRLAATEARTHELETVVEQYADLDNRRVYRLERLEQHQGQIAFALVRLAEAADRIAVTTDALTIYASTANKLAGRSWWRRLLGRGAQ